MDYNQFRKEIQKAIDALPKNSEFELNKLLKGTDWSAIPPDKRRDYGKRFADDVRNGQIPNVTTNNNNKRKNNHSIYEKI